MIRCGRFPYTPSFPDGKLSGTDLNFYKQDSQKQKIGGFIRKRATVKSRLRPDAFAVGGENAPVTPGRALLHTVP